MSNSPGTCRFHVERLVYSAIIVCGSRRTRCRSSYPICPIRTKLLEGSGLEGKSLEEIVKGSFGKNAGLFNNAGQHYNHTHFWKWMKPNGGGDKIPAKLKAKIDSDLGGVAKMKEDFVQAGVTQFGSGWCWIAVQNGKLAVTKTPNGENPLVHGGTPILGCDVWEHSYYIDYRNRRPDYLKAFLDHLVNWDYVEELFGAATK
jgi:Fe-Mn family superoxide dismutase